MRGIAEMGAGFITTSDLFHTQVVIIFKLKTDNWWNNLTAEEISALSKNQMGSLPTEQ